MIRKGWLSSEPPKTINKGQEAKPAMLKYNYSSPMSLTSIFASRSLDDAKFTALLTPVLLGSSCRCIKQDSVAFAFARGNDICDQVNTAVRKCPSPHHKVLVSPQVYKRRCQSMSMSSQPVTEQEIQALVTAIPQNLVNTYINMSAIAFLVYDILINLNREIEYVWKERWTISTILFLFGRYYGLLYNIANFVGTTTLGLSLNLYVDSCCRGWLWYSVLGGEIPFSTVVNIILTMRLYAVYQNRKALGFFIFLLICEFGMELYVCIRMEMETSDAFFSVPAGLPLPGCLAFPDIITYPDRKITLLAWVPCMVVSTVFFIMTIVKFMSEEDGMTLQGLMKLRHISPLLVSIVQDGALFYFLMFAIVLASAIMMQTIQGMFVNMLMPWLIAIYSLSASRLVLNLRETRSRTQYGISTESALLATALEPMFALNPMSEIRSMESQP